MAIDVQDVIDEYGDYYLDHGQNQTDLLQRLHTPEETAAEFLSRPTTETILRKGTSELTRVLQPFQQTFTPLGNLTFKPNPIELFQMKIDVTEYPDDIVGSWVGFLEGPGIKREEWPFVRWFIEVHLIDKAKEDFELNEVWAGVFVAPTPGTPGAAGTSMDGIKKLFADHSALTNTIAMGAIPGDDADFVSYVEDMVLEIDREERKLLRKLYMNADLEAKYRRGKRAKYNTNYAQESDLLSVIDYPQIKVKGLTSMGSDETLWATRETNKLRPIKKQQFSNLQIEGSKRAVSIFTDWWTVCSFARWESVYLNDL